VDITCFAPGVLSRNKFELLDETPVAQAIAHSRCDRQREPAPVTLVLPMPASVDVQQSPPSVKTSNSSEADLTQLEDYVVTPKDDWQTVGPSGEAKTMLATNSVVEEPENVSRSESLLH